MSETPAIVNRYYPTLSSIVSEEEIPNVLGFIKEGILYLFDKIHYKDLQYSKSPRGDAAFYSLTLVTGKRLDIEVPGTGIYLVLNADNEDLGISAFPITIEYEWKVLAFLRGFSINNFSFSPKEIFEMALRVLNTTEEQAMAHFINTFTVPVGDNTPLQQYVEDIGISSLEITEETTLKEIAQQVYQETGKYSSLVGFGKYLLNSSVDETLVNVKVFFRALLPEDIDAYIRDILIPKFRATLLLNAGVEFPRSILQPVYPEGDGNDQELEVIPEGTDGYRDRVLFTFGEALFYADTTKGFGYNLDIALNSSSPAMIGDTGLVIDIHNLKIDLSRDENIAEADLDGRPPEFMGVYVERTDIYLPKKWFKDEQKQDGTGQTLAVTGDHLIVGTGGVSGTIALRATYGTFVNEQDEQKVDSYYSEYFNLVYSNNVNVIVDTEGNMLPISNYEALLSYINTLQDPRQLKFKYPLTVEAGGGLTTFYNETEYNTFLKNLLVTTDTNRYLWFKLGKDENKAWQIGFEKFDITFHHGEVVESNLHAQLVIPKFKNLNNGDNADDRAIIDLVGHWESREDFRLSAQFLPTGLTFDLFGLLNFTLETAALGKEEDVFYLEADTKISFPQGTLASSLFGGQEVDIPALRYYFDGRFEIVGGNAFIPVNFTLPIGPIDMSVTGVHLGNEQRNKRSYNYIGFDGGLSVNPLGLDVRGNGVKFYYTIDNDEYLEELIANGEVTQQQVDSGEVSARDYGDSFFQISTIELDLIIPGNASPSTATAIIKGSLTIPEPGVSTEYIGKISVQLPKAKIYGEANMRLDPKYPAYLIDASVEFPAAIPLGSIGIFGFRGLLGYRYVAEKESVGLTYDDRWYDYYMTPQRGINVDKFSGPSQTQDYNNPFSIGVGASIATMDGGGRTASLRAMMLLSVPSVFAIDAGLTILSERLGLAEDDPRTPPFFAFVFIGDDSLEVGAGADFSINNKGWILHIQARMEMGFFFKNQRPWYINFGTREQPVTATLFKDILNINAYTFLMLSAAGIEVGAGVVFDFDFKVAKAEVSIEVGGFISFRRPHTGGFMHLEGMVMFDFWIIAFELDLDFFFRVELVKPFLILAEITLKACAKLLFVRACLNLKLKFKWEKNKIVDREPIPAITYEATEESTTEYGSDIQTANFVKGVHMVTYETFDIDFIGVRTSLPSTSEVGNNYIPLDTYIDIKSEKGLIPSNNVSRKIGGHTGGAKDYLDAIPPKRQVGGGGDVLRQVIHKYSIENIEIKAAKGNAWVDYEPVRAVLPTDQRGGNDLYKNRLGYWQKNNNNGRYDTLRILATNPFSFLDGAEQGWFIPEQYGITPSTLFCVSGNEEFNVSNVLNNNMGTVYYPSEQPQGANLINGAYYTLLGTYSQGAEVDIDSGEVTEIPIDVAMTVTNAANNHGFAKSLTFNNANQLIILIPESSVDVNLHLTTFAPGVTIKYYRIIPSDNMTPVYEEIVSVYKTQAELESVVLYEGDGNNYETFVSKIVVIPDFPEIERILEIHQQIANLWAQAEENAGTDAITIILTSEEQEQLDNLEAKLQYLREKGCTISENISNCDKNKELCQLYEDLLSVYNTCYPVNLIDVKKICDYLTCFESFMNLYLNFDHANTSYNLLSIYIENEHEQLSTNYSILQSFCNKPGYSDSVVMNAINLVISASTDILSIINDLGNCDCDHNIMLNCTTSFQQMKWKTVEQWQYEATIPGQDAVKQDSSAMIEGIQTLGQAIWRPNTTYLLKFSLRDTVDNNAVDDGGDINSKTFDYYYGFKTAGPLGHFHNHPQVDYIAPDTSENEYPITSLGAYIDYKRSYPNADGNLLKAKPIFYGNEQCKIEIFFSKPHVFHMLNDWEDYENLGSFVGAMNIAIKDPVSGVVIPYPLPEDWQGHETVPETIGNGENGISWVDDNDPRVPLNIQLINNFIQYLNEVGVDCQMNLGDPIQPAANAFSVTLSNLKPNKLYTALIYNAFGQINSENLVEYEKNQRIHEFVFKTSRYSNFEEQVNSYKLQEFDKDENVIDEKLAIYSIELELSNEQVSNAWELTQGNTNDDINTIALQYHHDFDRILEGILEITPLNPPTTTEFIIFKKKSTDGSENGTVPIGILIRNPEPFNDPKISLNEIEDSIKVLFATSDSENQSYRKIFSKDYSQIWLMNGLQIPQNNLKFKFNYLLWNGQTSTYTSLQDVITEIIEINP